MKEKQTSVFSGTSLWQNVKSSAREFKNLKVVTACGILAALGVVLRYVASIDIGQFIRIGFSDLPNVVASTLFGPVVGGVFAGVLDVIKYLIKPTGPFFPPLTVCCVVSGVILGLFLYHRPLKLYRVFLAYLTEKIVVGIVLKSWALSILYESAMAVVLPTRILTNLIMLPIDTVIAFLILKAVRKVWDSGNLN